MHYLSFFLCTYTAAETERKKSKIDSCNIIL